MSQCVEKLGQALVELLEEGGQVDVTAHWMAHYLAELMDRARNQTGLEQREAEREAAELVFEIWRHRTYLPGRYPLANFEPVLRTLDRLSRPDPWHPFHPAPPPHGDVDAQAREWLNRAETIDRGSKAAIRYCLAKAVAAGAAEESGWLEHLKMPKFLSDEASKIVLRLMSSENADDAAEGIRQKHLKEFKSTLEILCRDIAAGCSRIPSFPADASAWMTR
jgi:hypothetical protein